MVFNFSDGKDIFVTDGRHVLTNSTTQSILQCNYKEADRRLVIHDVLKKGLSTVHVLYTL